MPDFDVKEKRFEQDIEEYLVTEGGYQKGDPRAFDREKALDVVRRASRIMYELPKCRFLGWDIAFLANGEVAVLECNWRQGVETQIPHGRGMYHELEALKAKR